MQAEGQDHRQQPAQRQSALRGGEKPWMIWPISLMWAARKGYSYIVKVLLEKMRM
jgi:hypothetical protein